MNELLQKLESLELHEDQMLAWYVSELVKLQEECCQLLERHCRDDVEIFALEEIRGALQGRLGEEEG